MDISQFPKSVNCAARDFDDILPLSLGDESTALSAVIRCCRQLGAAMRVESHRALIESLATELSPDAEVRCARECLSSMEVARAMSTCLTSLEQAYHWPASLGSFSATPASLTRLKFIAHHVLFTELREGVELDSTVPEAFAQASIRNGYELIETLSTATAAGVSSSTRDDLQFRVNLLFRTSQQDITFQQSTEQKNRQEMEFGALHEAMYTNGTMRRMGEVFDEENGLTAAAVLLGVTADENSEFVSQTVVDACASAQRIAVRLANLMHQARFDLPVWGATYLRFAKAVPPSTLNGTGVDTSAIQLLDALLGNCDGSLPCELRGMQRERQRYLPPHLRRLIDDLSTKGRSIRSLVMSEAWKATDASRAAFLILCQHFFCMLEQHRKLALGIAVALRSAGIAATAGGFGHDKTSRCAAALSCCDDWDMACRVDAALRQSIETRPCWRFSCESVNADARPIRGLLGHNAPCVAGDELSAALVEICIPAEVLAYPGDRISLRLKEDAESYRTYTIVHSQVDALSQATLVRIAVKNCRGKVSSPLCTWGRRSCVSVRIEGTPRNRLAMSLAASQPGLQAYVAQGSAACGPILWLTHGAHLKSLERFALVVCCRNWSSVPLRSDVIALASTPNVEVTVVLTKADDSDAESIARCAGVQLFVGRVNNYLASASCRWGADLASGYITGGTAFGTAVLRALHVVSMQSPPNDRPVFERSGWSPHLRRAPLLKLDVYSPVLLSSLSGLREVSHGELALHNKPLSDAWIGVRGFVCDVTPLIQSHPGGQSVLVQLLGLDATRMFELAHGGSDEACSMMKSLIVARLASAKPSYYNRLEAWVTVQNTATNTSRCIAWPSGCSADDTPPIYFLTNGLRQWSRSVARWESEHCGTSHAQQLIKAAEGFCERRTNALRSESTLTVATQLRCFFDRFAVVWEGLHVHIDALKHELCDIGDPDVAVFVDSCTSILSTA